MCKEKKSGLVLLCLLLSGMVFSQQLRLGKNPYSLQKSAILELESDNQGLLFPRISDTSLINGLAPPDGMVIYHLPSKQLMIRSGGSWRGLASALAGLSDAGISTPTNGQLLAYNGSKWVNYSPAYLTTIDSSNISNFHGKVKSLFSAGAGLSYSAVTGRFANTGVLSLNGNAGALTMDTGYINNFYLKTRGLLSAGSGISYNATTGVIASAINTAAFWNLSGNAGSNPANHFIGTTDAQPLVIRTGNAEQMRFSADGHAAIGTSSFDASNPEKLLVDAGTTLSYNVISGKGSIDNYLQLNIQNRSGGGTASSDLVATADNGSETQNFVDLGMNSSGFTNNTYPILNGVNNAYLYSTGNDFMIGNATSGKNLRFFTGGYATTNERMRIDGSGKVGIGTTSPSSLLHLKSGTTDQSGLRLENLTSSSATTAGAATLGIDASGNVVRAKSPVFYSGGIGGSATVDGITKIWVADVANTSNGIQTITIPANVAFSSIVSITLTTKGGSDPTNTPVASVTSNTNSAITIRVLESKTTSILLGGSAEGMEAHTNTSTRIYIRVEGN